MAIQTVCHGAGADEGLTAGAIQGPEEDKDAEGAGQLAWRPSGKEALRATSGKCQA